MATYKVIQDIEAEDKLLGPLTLRQFVYACIVVVTGFVAFRLLTINWLLALPLLPPMFFFGLLAAPFGKDQSSEVWLLAKIRFFLKPKRRIWDQSGIKELVTITAPKRIERNLTKDFSQTEVKSRLKALANTIDSRGWAVKNVNVNLFAQPAYSTQAAESDRLVDVSDLPQEVSGLDIQASDDMLDETNNPIAQKLNQMIASSSKTHRQEAVKKMQSPVRPKSNEPPADYWFMNQSAATPKPGFTTARAKVVAPGQNTAAKPAGQPTAEEKAMLSKIHADQAKPKAAYGHMKTIDPLGEKPTKPAENKKHMPDPSLAFNNDWNVETVARQANKPKSPPDDEVVIPLR